MPHPKRFLAALGMLVAVCLCNAAWAQYPERALRLVVPYAAGGGTDAFSRLVAEMLGRELKQSVVVENRGGAGAIVGTQAVASAPADGYTLLIATNGNMVVTPLVYSKLNYDVKRDFKVLAILGEAPTVVVVNPSVPAKNLREFGAYIKANPSKANFASLGQGNALYIATRILEADLGLAMSEIPYKGSAPALTALMAGDVPMFVDLASTSIPLAKAGKVRPLAVPHRQRLPWFPDVPTFAEEGLTPLHAPSWMGLAFSSGVPPAAIAAVQAAARKVAADPRLKTYMDNAGMVPVTDADDMAGAEKYLDADRERWGAAVKRFKIKLD